MRSSDWLESMLNRVKEYDMESSNGIRKLLRCEGFEVFAINYCPENKHFLRKRIIDKSIKCQLILTHQNSKMSFFWNFISICLCHLR